MGVRPTEHSAINNRMVRWSHSPKTNKGKKERNMPILTVTIRPFLKIPWNRTHVNKDHMIIR